MPSRKKSIIRMFTNNNRISGKEIKIHITGL